MRKYRVIVVGLGKRGLNHALMFKANPRFELVGVATRQQAKLDAALAKLGPVPASTDIARMAATARPDVFCFCTPPSARTELIELGIRSGARLIAFEKPIALSSAEAMRIRQLLRDSGTKAVVCHQHRYGEHYRKVREIIASGALGRVHTVYGTSVGWMLHLMSHLLDYVAWFNGSADAQWVLAQAAGRGKLNDAHPSPDYIAGFIQFANGVRGIVECGAGAPDVPEVDYWWRKNRIGAQGTDGFAEVLTGGGWRAATKAGAQSGPGCMNYDLDMPPYLREVADWLDDEHKVHPCNFEAAYQGFEILMGLCRSVVEGGQVAFPLTAGADELKALREKLPDKKVLLGAPSSAKEYGLIGP
jgi:predicted dehydrogenase